MVAPWGGMMERLAGPWGPRQQPQARPGAAMRALNNVQHMQQQFFSMMGGGGGQASWNPFAGAAAEEWDQEDPNADEDAKRADAHADPLPLLDAEADAPAASSTSQVRMDVIKATTTAKAAPSAPPGPAKAAPDLVLKGTKRALCKHFDSKQGCQKGDSCTYAHGDWEIGMKYEVKVAKMNKPCFKFAEGQCEKGESCLYVHSEEESVGHDFSAQTGEKAWLASREAGGGRLGSSAKASSSAKAPSSANVQAETPIDPMFTETLLDGRGVSARLCGYFAQGKCWKGDTCLYAHVKPEDDEEDEELKKKKFLMERMGMVGRYQDSDDEDEARPKKVVKQEAHQAATSAKASSSAWSDKWRQKNEEALSQVVAETSWGEDASWGKKAAWGAEASGGAKTAWGKASWGADVAAAEDDVEAAFRSAWGEPSANSKMSIANSEESSWGGEAAAWGEKASGRRPGLPAKFRPKASPQGPPPKAKGPDGKASVFAVMASPQGPILASPDKTPGMLADDWSRFLRSFSDGFHPVAHGVEEVAAAVEQAAVSVIFMPVECGHGGENAVRAVAGLGGRGYLLGVTHELHKDLGQWGAAAILNHALADGPVDDEPPSKRARAADSEDNETLFSKAMCKAPSLAFNKALDRCHAKTVEAENEFVDTLVSDALKVQEPLTPAKELRRDIKTLGTVESLQDPKAIPHLADRFREHFLNSLTGAAIFSLLGEAFIAAKGVGHRKAMVYTVHELVTRKKAVMAAEGRRLSCLQHFLIKIGANVRGFKADERAPYCRLVSTWQEVKAFNPAEISQLKDAWDID